MQNLLIILQIIISISLITVILLQKRGTGLGGAFGGGGGGATYTQKRGAEKILYNLTIVLGILFVGVAFVILLAS